MEPAAYIAAHLPHALAEQATYGVPASVSLAQGALESGWGESVLALAGHAHHGIKASGKPGVADNPHTSGVISKITGEWFGEWTTVEAAFLAYPDDAEGYLGHGYYLRRRGLYGAAFEADTHVGFVRGLAAAGYATDPGYADKVLNLIDTYRLTQYDRPREPAMATPLTPDRLLTALRAEGLTVREYPGWRDRCRCHTGSHQAGGPTVRGWGPINGTMVHITAGGLGSRTVESYIRDIIVADGTSTPSKSQFVTAPDGTVWLVSAGRCNHAGTVSSRSVDALTNGTLSLSGWQDLRGHDIDGNSRMYGIENITPQTMSAAQRESSVRICAAISRAYGWDGRDAIGHGEASDQRGYADPNLNMGEFRRDVMARIKGTTAAPTPAAPTTTVQEDDMALTADDIYQIAARAVREAATPADGWPGATLSQVVSDLHRKVVVLEAKIDALATAGQTAPADVLVDVRTVAAAVAPLLTVTAEEA